MRKIVSAPNQILMTVSKPIGLFDSNLKRLVKEMEEILSSQVDPQGVGLAAPQIGVGLSLFIMKPSTKHKLQVFINPKILKKSNISVGVEKEGKKIKNSKQAPQKSKKSKLEGCLSVPRFWSPISRAHKVLLQYQNMNGETKKEWFSGFDAVIIQHEVDHLDGILFTQRALEQNVPLYEEKEGKLKKVAI